MRGNPAYDQEMKRAYEQVSRAYQKAVTMIEEVGTSRNKALTEEAVEASLIESIRILEQTVEPSLIESYRLLTRTFNKA